MVKQTRNPRVWETQKKTRRKRKKEQISSGSEQKDSRCSQASIPEQSEQLNHQQNFVAIEKKKRDKEISKRNKIHEMLFESIGSQNVEQEQIVKLERESQAESIAHFIKNNEFSRDNPEILYLYGSPGTGKTYLIKNYLIQNQLMKKTLWINCFSILSETFVQQKVPENEFHQAIVVLDEFDLLFSRLTSKSFQLKLKQFLDSLVFGAKNELRYILISNKGFSSEERPSKILSNLINYSRLVEIPFLPYSLKAITSIIRRKLNNIEVIFPEDKVDFSLITIAINKIYSTSQDVRKVLNFILDNFELLLISQNENKSRVKFIEQLTKNKTQNEESLNLECNYLRQLSGNQKLLLKSIILEYQEAYSVKKSYFSKNAYVAGRKLKLKKQTVDVWIQEWVQMGIIKRSPYIPKNEHLLEKLYILQILLPMKEYKQYFF